MKAAAAGGGRRGNGEYASAASSSSSSSIARATLASFTPKRLCARIRTLCAWLARVDRFTDMDLFKGGGGGGGGGGREAGTEV